MIKFSDDFLGLQPDIFYWILLRALGANLVQLINYSFSDKS